MPQVPFFEFVVLPLFQSFACVFPGVQPLVDLAQDNYKSVGKAAGRSRCVHQRKGGLAPPPAAKQRRVLCSPRRTCRSWKSDQPPPPPQVPAQPQHALSPRPGSATLAPPANDAQLQKQASTPE